MSNPTILRHTFAFQPYAHNSFWDGWTPSLTGHLVGPVPSGAELTAELSKDGATRWSGTTGIRAAGSGEVQEVRLGSRDEEEQLREDGTFGLTLRVVSELDGVDELVHEGTITLVHDDGAYRVDDPERLGVGEIGIDVRDCNHPHLAFSLWYPGDADGLDAHLFYEGKRLRPGDDDDPADIDAWGTSIRDQRNNTTYARVLGSFRRSRVFANGHHSDEGSWFVLDRNPGAYEIKILRDAKLDRSIPFTVGTDGRIVAAGAIEADPKFGWVISAPVVERGATPAPVPGGGDGSTLDDVYADREVPEPVDTATSGEGALDDDVQDALDSAVDKASNLHTWYFDTMETGQGNGYDLYDQCTGVGIHVPMTLAALDSVIAQIGGTRPVEWFGDTRTLADVRAEMVHLGERAQHWVDLRDGATASRLAPFRALLQHDKLAIFDDRPAGNYRYFGRNKRELVTPDDIAGADTWWFEGSEFQGTKDERWSLIGWRFDADGHIVERLGTSGSGRFAPVAEFS